MTVNTYEEFVSNGKEGKAGVGTGFRPGDGREPVEERLKRQEGMDKEHLRRRRDWTLPPSDRREERRERREQWGRGADAGEGVF